VWEEGNPQRGGKQGRGGERVLCRDTHNLKGGGLKSGGGGTHQKERGPGGRDNNMRGAHLGGRGREL